MDQIFSGVSGSNFFWRVDHFFLDNRIYEGVLKDALAKVNDDPFLAETQEMIEVSASQVAKKVGTGVLNVRKGGFPAINMGTEGYSKLFRSILKEQTV